jgi:murein DD-endopeptidase MepM/ murein hydrolase activator NlpD
VIRAVCLLLLLGWATAAAADCPLALDGPMRQGGLVVGRTAPGATVNFAGQAVRVAPDGAFIVGFHRDEPAEVPLQVTCADGVVHAQTLQVAARDYDIQRVDGLPPRKVTPSAEDLKRIREEAARVAEARQRDNARTDFLGGFIWPAQGPISGVYGSQRILNGEPRQPHYGVDIAAPAGTVVVAPAAGVVSLAEPDLFFSGGTLMVDHGHGLSSAFLHLSKILVEPGAVVRQGQPIAEIGATGRVSGAHLDWRMNLFQRRIDPQLLVGPMPEG